MSSLKPKQSSAKLRKLRVSPRKLNDVARLIRRLSAAEALNQLQFCQRRISKDVRKCLLSAIANAENNFNMDVDALYVSEAFVGKDMLLKRFRARAKGRGNRIEKFFSNIEIILEERV